MGHEFSIVRRRNNMTTLSAIPIKPFWIDKILEGTKTWEIRTKSTKKIGPVALIRSGCKIVVATAFLSEVKELTASLARANCRRMGMSAADAAASVGCYAWVLKDVITLKKPVSYVHPPGAVTWVTLDEATTKEVHAEAKRSCR